LNGLFGSGCLKDINMKKLFFVFFITTGLHSMINNQTLKLEIERLKQELQKDKIKLNQLYEDTVLLETVAAIGKKKIA
jgi:hypothetical protein